MLAFTGKPLRSLITVTALCLIIIFIKRQFGYTDQFTLAGELSELINIISRDSISIEHPDNSELLLDSKIPNVIHQIWKTNDVGTYSTELEASLVLWRNMFEPLNYTVKLWTDDAILQLVKDRYPWILPTYESYPESIQRADIARLLVIHAEGGIYADLDVYPTSTQQIQCLQRLGLQAVFASTSGTLGLSNHFFMAERGFPFLLWALNEAKRRASVTSRHIFLPYLKVFWSTGPTMVTEAFRKHAWMYGTLQYDMGLLENGYSRAVIRHAAGRSWHRMDGQALNYIADHFRMDTALAIVGFILLIPGLVYLFKALL